MTLGEGKKKVYELIDEYSSGGSLDSDADIEIKMADFFDIAQKQVAAIQKIIKIAPVERVEGVIEYEVPEDFGGLRRVWYEGKPSTGRFSWRGNRIMIPPEDRGLVELEYFAIPATVDASTPDDYEFEVREDGCQAMCFYVAAQQLVVDLIIDYGALYQLYQQQLATLYTELPGGVQFKNTFFRG